MKIVCLSDTHLTHQRDRLDVPDGDLLLHAGDATSLGTIDEIRQFRDWYAALPHRHKIFVAGNHDWGFQRDPDAARAALGPDILYLQDSEVTIAGLRIYGSPWQPEFCDWAFNLPRGHALLAKWKRIPSQVDVLITHGPPLGIGDRTLRGEPVGCHDLLHEVTVRIRPRLHLFGHIHEGYGQYDQDGIVFLNASVVDAHYRIAHPPLVIDLPNPDESKTEENHP